MRVLFVRNLAGQRGKLAATNPRYELAKFAFLVVPVQSRICFCVFCLQFLQFIANLLSGQVSSGRFITPAAPDFQGILAIVE